MTHLKVATIPSGKLVCTVRSSLEVAITSISRAGGGPLLLLFCFSSPPSHPPKVNYDVLPPTTPTDLREEKKNPDQKDKIVLSQKNDFLIKYKLETIVILRLISLMRLVIYRGRSYFCGRPIRNSLNVVTLAYKYCVLSK